MIHLAAVATALAAQFVVQPIPPGAPTPARKPPPAEARVNPADAVATIDSIVDEPDIADQGCTIRTQGEEERLFGTPRASW
jgi:hypothetical protein